MRVREIKRRVVLLSVHLYGYRRYAIDAGQAHRVGDIFVCSYFLPFIDKFLLDDILWAFLDIDYARLRLSNLNRLIDHLLTDRMIFINQLGGRV